MENTTPALETLFALVAARAPRDVIDAHKLTLTPAEREILFGDVRFAAYKDSGQASADYKAMLIDRLKRGLPLTKASRIEAKRAMRANG